MGDLDRMFRKAIASGAVFYLIGLLAWKKMSLAIFSNLF
jgi:hypothetical protein